MSIAILTFPLLSFATIGPTWANLSSIERVEIIKRGNLRIIISIIAIIIIA